MGKEIEEELKELLSTEQFVTGQASTIDLTIIIGNDY